MATGLDAMLRNIASFYDFAGKSIVHVGAGGGQLIDYAANARSVLAVDPDADAIRHLKEAIERKKYTDRFEVIEGLFESVTAKADVVFFEVCLHEMDDPDAALARARSLAPDVVVIDHLPESPWSWYACETEKLERSWAAVERLPGVRKATYAAVQRFRDYTELAERFQVLGEPALTRIREFEGKRNIEIDMPYGMALISRV